MKRKQEIFPSDAGVWNVKSCGARGDGTVLDSAALQGAVDACHRCGGGRVLLPPGRYLSGTLLLKSGVELHLAQGATLLGSPRIDDYPTEPFAAFYVDRPLGEIVRSHLLAAIEAERIAVTGPGTIDGNGQAFFGPQKKDRPLRRFIVHDRRPCHMVAFFGCRDVLVQDVHLLHAPCYSFSPYGCERVRIEGVTIRNHPSTPNGDGIDPDCCRDLVIHGCLIDTADDAIALKSWGLPLAGGRGTQPCENVVISDCVLRSCTFAIRLGVEGDYPIRRVTMSNLVLQGRNGIGLYAIPHAKGNVLRGTPIDDVLGSQLLIETSSCPILAMQAPGSAAPAGIRNVLFSQVRAVSSCASVLYGSPEIPIENFGLRDVHLTVRGRIQNEAVFQGAVPPLTGFGVGRDRVPHALYGRHLRKARIAGLRVDWDRTSGPWDAALRLDDAEDILLEDADLEAAPDSPSGQAFQCGEVKGLTGMLPS